MAIQLNQNTVVVVTGASAGVGRAIAGEFARQGCRIALLARDGMRLEKARAELAEQASHVVAIPLDVADARQVEAAAGRIEQELGPIDVWINNAMVTVVGPVSEVSAGEFRRVTDVTYLGTVHGTLAALKRMKPRNRGSVVQIGSALAYRSIPLQAPYCAAKHAVRGFTESVRCELLHERSGIHIGIVELPAVNTPQFDWCQTTLDKQPKPLGKVYQPEVIARAVVHCVRTARREMYVTFSSAKAIWGDKLFPGLLDRYLANKAVKGQKSKDPVQAGRSSNLWAAVPGPYGAHGRFDDRAKASSASLWVNMHKGAMAAAAAAALLVAVAATRTRRHSP